MNLPRLGLSGIVILYLAIGVLFATRTPLWQAPDEPAHYNVIRQIAENECCPVMAAGDWDQVYLENLKATGFANAALAERLYSVQYEDQQPPLYYLLATPIYEATNGNPVAIRLFSLLLGAGTVICAFAVTRIIFPPSPVYALLTAGFVAFLPQNIAMMSAINNDSLACLIVGLTLVGGAIYLKQNDVNRERRLWLVIVLGILLGLAFVTKLTIYPLAAIVLVLIVWRQWSKHGVRSRLLWRDLLIIFSIAIVIGGIFWLRNLNIYGGADFLAQAVHDRVVVGQPQTAAYVAKQGIGRWSADFGATVFRSFWGQFGWMGVPMTDRIYLILAGLTGFAGLGGLIFLIGQRATWLSWTRAQRGFILIAAILFALTFGTLIYWNLKYVQFQGRYLFPALIPIALAFAGGFGTWFSLIRTRWSRLLSLVLVVGLATFDIYVLFRIIVPAFGG